MNLLPGYPRRRVVRSVDSMDILLIGSTGILGTRLQDVLRGRGHDVVGVARHGGDLHYDVSEPDQVRAMYEAVGRLDAVVSAAGAVVYKPFGELQEADYAASFTGKVLSQINLVRLGSSVVRSRGSFTLITGVLGRLPILTGAAASMANGAVESFVRTAAIEVSPQRINAVSPTVFTESLEQYGSSFPGMASVDLDTVALSYVRSVEGAQTGQIYVPYIVRALARNQRRLGRM